MDKKIKFTTSKNVKTMLANKYNLGFFPTPLEELSNLSSKFLSHRIFIKRDDNSGLASGGNKTRKLEYLIYDALKNGYDTIITAGAQQSNHCRQTAAACAKAGLQCHLLLGGEEPQHFSGNLLLSKLLGATIHFTGTHRKGEDLESVKTDIEKNGSRVYTIPYGGSNIIGALGFVNAVKELKQQMTSMAIDIDYVFFASSSGGTQAGMILGKAIYDLNATLIPISIDNKGFGDCSLDEIVLNILTKGKTLFKLERDFSIEDAKLIKGYDDSGYGTITSNEKEAIRSLAHSEGILLDPVYSGRAFYGMLDHLKSNKLKPESNILFWHTGGLPANFHYSDELMMCNE